jgi:class 3 adenylate cyclase
MAILRDIHIPQELELVVAYFDLTGFARFCVPRTAAEVFDTLSAYYEFVGEIVEGSGGTVVKFIGDAGLIVYPAVGADQGVVGLKRLKEAGDRWLADHDVSCRHIIKAHVGPVFCGYIGTSTDRRFDVLGGTVNIAVTLQSSGLAITPQLFRKLDPETRKLFKRYTPPVTYIPIEEQHKD